LPEAERKAYGQAPPRYISIGGTLNPQQPALIRSAIERLPTDGQLIIATDNDAGGDALAEQIKTLAAVVERPDLIVTEDRPPECEQDWNEYLKILSSPQIFSDLPVREP